ncbi:MAG: SMC-Scp complex subunit ScpB [Rhodospirillales bacterium]|nr:SMC-Scp complex subunit ScpB [Rhodospirillales bacterium]
MDSFGNWFWLIILVIAIVLFVVPRRGREAPKPAETPVRLHVPPTEPEEAPKAEESDTGEGEAAVEDDAIEDPEPEVTEASADTVGCSDHALGGFDTDATAAGDAIGDVESLHLRLVEALLFASADPVSERQLSRVLPKGADLAPLLAALEARYRDRGINLIRVDKFWAFRTAPDLGPALNGEQKAERKLSRAALETLAIVAYHQPVTRAEIEEIRGVQLSKGTLDVLMEAGWIAPRGRRQTPGRPATWGTTERFLDHFRFEGLGELPGADILKASGLLDARPAIQAQGARDEDGTEP